MPSWTISTKGDISATVPMRFQQLLRNRLPLPSLTTNANRKLLCASSSSTPGARKTYDSDAGYKRIPTTRQCSLTPSIKVHPPRTQTNSSEATNVIVFRITFRDVAGAAFFNTGFNFC
jgi:hypothetical protein